MAPQSILSGPAARRSASIHRTDYASALLSTSHIFSPLRIKSKLLMTRSYRSDVGHFTRHRGPNTLQHANCAPTMLSFFLFLKHRRSFPPQALCTTVGTALPSPLCPMAPSFVAGLHLQRHSLTTVSKGAPIMPIVFHHVILLFFLHSTDHYLESSQLFYLLVHLLSVRKVSSRRLGASPAFFAAAPPRLTTVFGK